MAESKRIPAPTENPAFVLKQGLLKNPTIEQRDDAYILRDEEGFKQILKKSEYDELMNTSTSEDNFDEPEADVSGEETNGDPTTGSRKSKGRRKG